MISFSFFILAIFFIAAFFTLPYLFPSTEMVQSMSYDYGFSNQVGLLLVGFSIIVYGVIGYLKKDTFFSFFAKDSEKLSLRHLWIAFLLFALFVIWAFFCGAFILYEFNDANFFYCHLYEMILGRVPYKDFAFGYGPLTIYFPYWVYSLVPGISAFNAYLVSIFFFHSVGLYCFYDLTNAINVGKKEKQWMFWMGFLTFFPYTLGMNYQAFRFIFPFWFMWRCHHMGYRNKAVFFPLSVMIALAFSPEIGLVYWIALLIYCTLQYFVNHDKTYLVISVVSVVLNACFVIEFLPMFTFVLSFGSGFMNFPFIPSFHLLFFFLCVFVVAYYLGGAFLQLERFVLEISIAFLAFGLLPVCLGRCDPGHVVFNGFFIFLYCFVLVFKSENACKGFLVGLSVALVLMTSGFYWRTFGRFYLTAPFHNSSLHAFVDMGILPEKGKVAMPIISSFNTCLDYFMLLSAGKAEGLYYTRTSSVGTPSIMNTIGELRSKNPDYLLLNTGWQGIDAPLPYSINDLFYTYYFLRPKYNGRLINRPLVDYISENYKNIYSDTNYCVLERIDNITH